MRGCEMFYSQSKGGVMGHKGKLVQMVQGEILQSTFQLESLRTMCWYQDTGISLYINRTCLDTFHLHWSSVWTYHFT